MNNFKWSKLPIFWEGEDHRYCSVVFSWQLYKMLEVYKNNGPKTKKKIVLGGPATVTLRNLIPKEIIVRNNLPSLYKHNSFATKTSIGCPRSCSFCIVPTSEGEIKELKVWEIKPIVIDNNLLACSKKHFNFVVDNLKILSWCDFNQGLDARLLTKHHAERFAELHSPMIRLSFDHLSLEKSFLNAYQLLRNAKIPKYRIRVYVLIGYKDTPESALYRLQLVKDLGLMPNPMRYQPIGTFKKNSFVETNWSNKELIRYMRYWQNLRFAGHIPFKDFK